MTLYTIGHSTRSTEEFIGLLKEHGIQLLVDVRRFPGSRLHPHFGKEALQAALAKRGVRYMHMSGLGGRRQVRDDSVNTAWRNAGFRGYADYMASAEFRSALNELLQAAQAETPCVMCAEAVPWQCHRNLLADAVVAAGHEVVHILGAGHTQPHALHPSARIGEDGTITYPGGPEQPELL